MGERYRTHAHYRERRDTPRRWYFVVEEYIEYRYRDEHTETWQWKIVERYILGKSAWRAEQAERVRLMFRPPPGTHYSHVRVVHPRMRVP